MDFEGKLGVASYIEGSQHQIEQFRRGLNRAAERAKSLELDEEAQRIISLLLRIGRDATVAAIAHRRVALNLSQVGQKLTDLAIEGGASEDAIVEILDEQKQPIEEEFQDDSEEGATKTE